MVKKKICLVGAEAVGKTSLVRRFVKGIFSDHYLTTIGVKIDKKIVRSGSDEIAFVIWDIAGEDGLQELRTEYLDGAAGYLLVADGTRPETFDKAVELQRKVSRRLGEVPFLLIVNKSDLRSQWFDLARRLREAGCRDWTVLQASAKDGTGVEEAFQQLAALVAPVLESEAPDV